MWRLVAKKNTVRGINNNSKMFCRDTLRSTSVPRRTVGFKNNGNGVNRKTTVIGNVSNGTEAWGNNDAGTRTRGTSIVVRMVRGSGQNGVF